MIVGGVEVLAGELDDVVRIERLAGVHVDAEEDARLLPPVEVRAGRLPVDPPGPSEPVGSVGHGRCEHRHAGDLRQREEVVTDVDVGDRRSARPLDDQPLAEDLGCQVDVWLRDSFDDRIRLPHPASKAMQKCFAPMHAREKGNGRARSRGARDVPTHALGCIPRCHSVLLSGRALSARTHDLRHGEFDQYGHRARIDADARGDLVGRRTRVEQCLDPLIGRRQLLVHEPQPGSMPASSTTASRDEMRAFIADLPAMPVVPTMTDGGRRVVSRRLLTRKRRASEVGVRTLAEEVGQLLTAGDAELGVDPTEQVVDGARRDAQAGGDLPTREVGGGEVGDLALAAASGPRVDPPMSAQACGHPRSGMRAHAPVRGPRRRAPAGPPVDARGPRRTRLRPRTDRASSPRTRAPLRRADHRRRRRVRARARRSHRPAGRRRACSTPAAGRP